MTEKINELFDATVAAVDKIKKKPDRKFFKEMGRIFKEFKESLDNLTSELESTKIKAENFGKEIAELKDQLKAKNIEIEELEAQKNKKDNK